MSAARSAASVDRGGGQMLRYKRLSVEMKGKRIRRQNSNIVSGVSMRASYFSSCMCAPNYLSY